MRAFALAAAALAALAFSGCAAIGMARTSTLGAANYVYENGQAAQGFPFTAAQVQTAAVEAMSDLNIRQTRQTQDGPVTIYDGRTADGRRASVTVESRASLPLVTARFGWFGDEALSRAFMDRIGIRLGTLPPAAIPAEPPAAPEPPQVYTPGVVPRAAMPRTVSDAGYRDTPVP